jgi:hypothetical protein
MTHRASRSTWPMMASDLDGAGQVVDEVDQHPRTDQPEHQRSGHGQAGHERLPGARWIPTVCSPAVG